MGGEGAVRAVAEIRVSFVTAAVNFVDFSLDASFIGLMVQIYHLSFEFDGFDHFLNLSLL